VLRLTSSATVVNHDGSNITIQKSLRQRLPLAKIDR
jgi:hypothetical protein